METVRLFIGTYIDNRLILPHYDNIKKDFLEVCGGKWVEPENMHFTYKFIGDVFIPLAQAIKNTLKDTLKTYNNELKLQGMGSFPNQRTPKVLFIKIFNKDNLLRSIYRTIEAKMKPLGFEPEAGRFNPHLTLLRIKSYKSEEFSNLIEQYSTFDYGTMSSFKVSLIKSTLMRTGPIYEEY